MACSIRAAPARRWTAALGATTLGLGAGVAARCATGAGARRTGTTGGWTSWWVSRMLTAAAERGWRDMKGALGLRPIFHYREDRIRAHVQLCWLALLLIRVIENLSLIHISEP